MSSYPTNMTDITGFYIWANNEVGQLMGYGFLIVFFLAMFMVMKTFEAKKAGAAAAFGTAIMGIMMWALGIVEIRVAVICILMATFSLLWIMWDKD